MELLILKKGQDWVKTGFVPDINSEVYYEVISPSDCTVGSLLARVGEGGNIANLSSHNGNDKLAMTILTLHNPLGCECEVKLADASHGEVVVKATLNK